MFFPSNQPISLDFSNEGYVDISPQCRHESSIFIQYLLDVLRDLDHHGQSGALHQPGDLHGVAEYGVVGDLGADYPAHHLATVDSHPQLQLRAGLVFDLEGDDLLQ